MGRGRTHGCRHRSCGALLSTRSHFWPPLQCGACRVHTRTRPSAAQEATAMEGVRLLPAAEFAPWANYLVECEDLRASGLRLVEDFHTDTNHMYVCIEISCISSSSVDLHIQSAHITVGTYLVAANPQRRRISNQIKAETLCKQLTQEARGRTHYFDSSGAHVRLGLWKGDCSSVPAIFPLRLCQAGFALDRLVDGIQHSLSGVFEAVHGLGPRTMPYLRGPCFYLSMYSPLHIVRRHTVA